MQATKRSKKKGKAQLDTARLAVMHSLLRMDGFELSMEQRLRLLADLPNLATREAMDLRSSARAWEAAQSTEEVGFTDRHVRSAWRRLGVIDQRLCDRVEDSWRYVRAGRGARSSFWEDHREICRAALGQTIPHELPLVIVDEIHNWKNHPTSWTRFLHMLGMRVERLLGLSATPFQLGPHELIQVLNLRRCLNLSSERASFLDHSVATLGADLRTAASAGETLRTAWTDVQHADLADLEMAWSRHRHPGRTDNLPPRLRRAVTAAIGVRDAHTQLGQSLRPFLLRHRRDVSHRAWWVGGEAAPDAITPSALGGSLRWRPGLDVRGDAELVHYLMMRAVQEQKDGRGSTSLGADLGGSYAFFRDSPLRRMLPGRTEQARSYLELVERAVSGELHEHPKIAVTAERAFRSWLAGDKTLVFCFNVKTVDAVRNAINQRIDAHNTKVLTAAFECSAEDLDGRLKNLQRRLYYYRQAVFLLFQDHPLAGPSGRVPGDLALGRRGVDDVAVRLALGGPPRDRRQFDRRRILAAVEQVLVFRLQRSSRGRTWLERQLTQLRFAATTSEAIELITSPAWPALRRGMVEGVLREAEVEELPDEEDLVTARSHANRDDIDAWLDILSGRAGQAVLAPYLADEEIQVPSLLTRWHAAALAPLPHTLRAVAARMLRRMIRSPGFLARFILHDPGSRPSVEDDAADDDWTTLIHRLYQTPPAAGEAAKERFAAYLETLQKAVGMPALEDAYDQASKNRDVVTRVTGSVASFERDRLFTGFNTPMFPEVLVVTTVGQEGIDLHHECRHVIHHDLQWNPATLEQRTGRVDRIGSKTERLRINGNGGATLDVAVPYIAGTYDEHRFRVVHGRAHIFEVTMGGEYTVDGQRSALDDVEPEAVDDDGAEGKAALTPMPEVMAEDLRLRLEAYVARQESA